MTESSTLVQIVEAALLAAGKPLSIAQLGALFEERDRPTTAEFREALEVVGERCEGRGFELVEVASGFRFQVRESMIPWIGRLWQERPQRYSRALLETLALIAYRQPITRGEIEEIRGVAVSTNIIKTLHERDWIRVVGHRDVPGRPAMYATTRQFLDYFNLKSLNQLPALADIRDVETLNAELGFGEITESPDAEGADPMPQGDDDDAAEAVAATAVAAMTEAPASAGDEASADDPATSADDPAAGADTPVTDVADDVADDVAAGDATQMRAVEGDAADSVEPGEQRHHGQG